MNLSEVESLSDESWVESFLDLNGQFHSVTQHQQHLGCGSVAWRGEGITRCKTINLFIMVPATINTISLKYLLLQAFYGTGMHSLGAKLN